MINRGSLPKTALICAGLSSLTRRGPDIGRGEGRVIASVGSLNVRSEAVRRRAILAFSAIPLFLIAMWVRTPLLPGPGAPSAANENERAALGARASRDLAGALSQEVARLSTQADGALGAPSNIPNAFSYLAERVPHNRAESVILFDGVHPIAWAGRVVADTDSIFAPVSVSFSQFYTTLSVVRSRGQRRAVTSVILHASAPADRLVTGIDSAWAAQQG